MGLIHATNPIVLHSGISSMRGLIPSGHAEFANVYSINEYRLFAPSYEYSTFIFLAPAMSIMLLRATYSRSLFPAKSTSPYQFNSLNFGQHPRTLLTGYSGACCGLPRLR
jgi:hypothetical protein